MLYLRGLIDLAGSISWQTSDGGTYGTSGLTIVFEMRSVSRLAAHERLAYLLATNEVAWLARKYASPDCWLIDIEELKAAMPGLRIPEWLVGRHIVTPEFNPQNEGALRFSITRQATEVADDGALFPELKPSLEQFYVDHPNWRTCAFVMMRYDGTPLHVDILAGIRATCAERNISALRADEHFFAEDLLSNIRTYMHGSRFGIAVFERVTTDDFNPNVSLEVGYMLALGKPVCLLKDSTLKYLHTDLVGRLYQNFDTQRSSKGIPQLKEWLRDTDLP
jgi:hypothetical protein